MLRHDTTHRKDQVERMSRSPRTIIAKERDVNQTTMTIRSSERADQEAIFVQRNQDSLLRVAPHAPLWLGDPRYPLSLQGRPLPFSNVNPHSEFLVSPDIATGGQRPQVGAR